MWWVLLSMFLDPFTLQYLFLHSKFQNDIPQKIHKCVQCSSMFILLYRFPYRFYRCFQFSSFRFPVALGKRCHSLAQEWQASRDAAEEAMAIYLEVCRVGWWWLDVVGTRSRKRLKDTIGTWEFHGVSICLIDDLCVSSEFSTGSILVRPQPTTKNHQKP